MLFSCHFFITPYQLTTIAADLVTRLWKSREVKLKALSVSHLYLTVVPQKPLHWDTLLLSERLRQVGWSLYTLSSPRPQHQSDASPHCQHLYVTTTVNTQQTDVIKTDISNKREHFISLFFSLKERALIDNNVKIVHLFWKQQDSDQPW